MDRFSSLIPELQPYARELVRAAGAAGLLPRVTSTRRSYAEQKRLHDRYLAGMSPYPAAPPGHSAHEYGYAFDMIVSPLSDLISAGEYWESLGGIWGGRIGDEVHFEYPGFKVALGTTIDVAQGLDDQSNNPVARAVKALHDLPWYLALLVPEKLLLTERNENMEQWAADVFAWIRKHS